MPPLRIATRKSLLALWQANHVAELIRQQRNDLQIELIHVSTHGDQDQAQPLSEMGGTGVFTKEVQQIVLNGDADLAVHSLKDLPTEPTPGLTLAGIPGRETRWDALVLPATRKKRAPQAHPWDHLSEGARIGTGSIRRQAQILAQRADLKIENIRGNIDTRLKKLDAGEFDAVILAAAGLIRLGHEKRITATLEPPVLFPAVGQGALGIECRADESDHLNLLHDMSDRPTWLACHAERALLAGLRAGCHAPVGVNTSWFGSNFALAAIVLSADGTKSISTEKTFMFDSQQELDNWESAQLVISTFGQEVAQQLISDGADELIQQDD